MVFYMTLQSISGSVEVSIREDNNGNPGELVSELSTWNHVLSPMTQNGYNLIVTTDLCIYLDAGINYYNLIQERLAYYKSNQVHSLEKMIEK